MSDKSIYIIDSYGLIYRAYFALINHPLTNREGNNINSVVIFFKNLRALLKHYNPSFLAAAFDSRTPTFRHQMYSEYKATRAKTPEDLHAQIPWIEEILRGMGIPVLQKDGFEADDIIATVARKCREENRECRILSGDKDLLQLVTDTCLQMQPDKASGGWECLGINDVVNEWGVGPEKILDYLSLTGDAADNVPGVKGVGGKTAVKLLTQYQTLDGIYEHAEEIKGALGEKIRGDKDNAYFSKKLITLEENVPLDIDFESFKTDNLDFDTAASLLNKYGAFQVASTYSNNPAAGGNKQADTTKAGNKKAENKNKVPGENTENELLPKKTGAVIQNKGDYKGITKLEELSSIINDILSSKDKVIALDTETTGLNSLNTELAGFSLCNEEGKAYYVPVMLPGEMFAPETISKKDCLNELARLFADKDLTLVMHNGKFDLEVLKCNGLKEEASCHLFDTMIAAWLINPSESGKSPYSLESLGENYLGLKGIEFSDIVPKGSTFADIPLEEAVPYGAEDADFTFKLYKLFEPVIEKAGLHDLFYGMEMKILPILASMESAGIHLDKKALDEYGKELKKLIEEKEKGIYQAAGHEFNIASTKQLQQVLFEEQGLTGSKKTKTGYSTDTAVLEELSDSTDNPLPALILEYRSYTKLLNTYVETLPLLADKESRVHTSFMQTGTATGRLSSKEPNLQNIPVRDENGRRIRSAFTAIPGTVLISADYAQIELVILSHLSGDKNLSQSFIDGTDVHKATAALIYGIKPEEVSPEQRRFAKTVNFGVMYGMSAFRLAKELGISRTEAKNFIDQYFNTYSGVKAFIDNTIEDARSKGYVETITGRRRYVNELRNTNKMIQQSGERIAVNSPIQGSAADIVKKAMIDVNEELKKQKLPVKMLLQVHDELIFECPDDEESIKKAITLITDKMEHTFKLNVPLRVSVEYGKNWGCFH
ncbi:DNA polymerase I [Treponema sp.]|uniref:DNA polymerase I n=1 Tax=Treponema sp. TaxID=166 RepID=UPI0025FB860F|nr:DNA polymerase I [Treponema sp.]MCR5217938.1 DNA polymerase I [Treponema sp.]